MLKKILLFVFLSFVSFSVFSMDGNKLYKHGKEYINPNSHSYVDIGIYIGYISGVLESNTIAYGPFCAPKKAIYDQAYEIVYNYLKNHPEKREQDASKLIFEALQSVWGCNN